MPLQSIQKELQKASIKGYAVPLFDVFDTYAVDGVLEALEEKRAPTILGFYARHFDHPNTEALSAYIRTRVRDTAVPVSLMLDHGESYTQCMKALDYGFNDVMYDGSQLPLEENIRNTGQIVQAAHARGAAVEAELGHVGWGSEYDVFGSQRLGFTDPDMVETFVRETGVDILAIAFGNAHGSYKGEPRLDLELVREIRCRVDIPLVMHGGTGLTDAQYREVVAAGIAKINIATVIMNRAAERMAAVANAPHADGTAMLDIANEMKHAYRDCCRHFYDVLETSGNG